MTRLPWQLSLLKRQDATHSRFALYNLALRFCQLQAQKEKRMCLPRTVGGVSKVQSQRRGTINDHQKTIRSLAVKQNTRTVVDSRLASLPMENHVHAGRTSPDSVQETSGRSEMIWCGSAWRLKWIQGAGLVLSVMFDSPIKVLAGSGGCLLP